MCIPPTPQQVWGYAQSWDCFIQGWGTQARFQDRGCGLGPRVDTGQPEAALQPACPPACCCRCPRPGPIGVCERPRRTPDAGVAPGLLNPHPTIPSTWLSWTWPSIPSQRSRGSSCTAGSGAPEPPATWRGSVREWAPSWGCPQPSWLHRLCFQMRCPTPMLPNALACLPGSLAREWLA